ncbi:MAG: FkbM family methyltransferase [Anaerolineales bacterium]|nr:FkbM family methyltransferase [Anaerolineales bacterium]MCB9431293.1 FkbM family methyltransferase [Ardenticatenaceae bacterium]
MTRQEIARLVLKSINTLGPLHGLRVSAQLLLSGGGETAVSLPGYQFPIQVRTNTSDVATFGQIFVNKEYECPVENPRVIIDLGANVGYASIFFANKYPQAKIISVEPEASNFEVLVRNTRQYPNITPVQAAIWSRKAALSIINPGDEKWLFQVAEASNDEEGINAITMQELLEMHGMPDHIDILKIDIESAEKELFEANYEYWLDRTNMLVIELHDGLLPGCSRSFYRALCHYDFNQYLVGENIFVFLSN